MSPFRCWERRDLSARLPQRVPPIRPPPERVHSGSTAPSPTWATRPMRGRCSSPPNWTPAPVTFASTSPLCSRNADSDSPTVVWGGARVWVRSRRMPQTPQPRTLCYVLPLPLTHATMWTKWVEAYGTYTRFHGASSLWLTDQTTSERKVIPQNDHTTGPV